MAIDKNAAASSAVTSAATALRIKNGGDISLQSDYEDGIREIVAEAVKAALQEVIDNGAVTAPGQPWVGTIA